MSGTPVTPPINRTELHRLLDDILDAADKDGGRLDQAGLWRFAASLAQGRGVLERFEREGIAAVKEAEGKYPIGEMQPARNDRIRRAYTLSILKDFLFDIATSDGRALFPKDFQIQTLVSDVVAMLGGNDGTGSGKPQMLVSSRSGEQYIRRYARDRFVCAVMYEAGARGCDPRSLLSEFRMKNLNGKTWADWLRKAVNAKAAHAADIAGIAPEKWQVSSENLPKLIELIGPDAQMPKK